MGASFLECELPFSWVWKLGRNFRPEKRGQQGMPGREAPKSTQGWNSTELSAGKTRPGADCGSDHKLLIVKFRLKLKKVGKTTRTFRYGSK